MKPAHINKALAEKGVRHVDVVTRLGMKKTSRPIVSMVISGNSRSRRVEKAISDITGVPLHELWPEWYSQSTSSTRPRNAA